MKGYKTVVFNSIITIMPAIDFLVANGKMLAPLLGPYGAGVVSVLGVANLILRAVTKTPVFKKS